MIIRIESYGIYTYAGKVSMETCRYFQENNIELEEYNEYLDYPESSSLNIPEEHNFAHHMGSCLYDVNNLWELQGADLIKGNTLTVETDNEDDDWECDLDVDTLKKHGIKVECIGSSDIVYDLPSDTAAFVATEAVKGKNFENNDVRSYGSFDPTKLEIYYHEHFGAFLVKFMKYDGIDIYDSNSEWDTVYKEFEWF